MHPDQADAPHSLPGKLRLCIGENLWAALLLKSGDQGGTRHVDGYLGDFVALLDLPCSTHPAIRSERRRASARLQDPK